jgi:hypothetical protein
MSLELWKLGSPPLPPLPLLPSPFPAWMIPSDPARYGKPFGDTHIHIFVRVRARAYYRGSKHEAGDVLKLFAEQTVYESRTHGQTDSSVAFPSPSEGGLSFGFALLFSMACMCRR